MNTDRIMAALAKGLRLTAADVRDIQAELALMPADQAHELEGEVWEGVALIVNDPDYEGDAKLPELEPEPALPAGWPRE